MVHTHRLRLMRAIISFKSGKGVAKSCRTSVRGLIMLASMSMLALPVAACGGGSGAGNGASDVGSTGNAGGGIGSVASSVSG